MINGEGAVPKKRRTGWHVPGEDKGVCNMPGIIPGVRPSGPVFSGAI